MLYRLSISVVVLLAAFGILYLSESAWADEEHPIGSDADEVLVGKIYQKDSNHHQQLFNFRRTAHHSGNETYVTRTYTYPDGGTAAVEKATYRDNKLIFYGLEEKQIGAHGQAEIHGDAWQGSGQISFRYIKSGKTYTDDEDLTASTVVNDDIVPYMLAHWDRLMQGQEVYLRYIVIPRTQTVGFNLIKSGKTAWKGNPAVIIKMVPSSFFIRLVVDPMYFTVEKNTRRVVKYEGRTTPKIKENGEWKDFDAVMVFHGSTKGRQS
jgi:hypothetical protein